MIFFLSHCSRDKPLVREIKNHLGSIPGITLWIDEHELRTGDKLKVSIPDAITKEADYVVVFVVPEFSTSKWLKRELRLALTRERKLQRKFVLPVVLDEKAWRAVQPKRFHGDPLYLKSTDFTESAVKLLAMRLRELFLRERCQASTGKCPCSIVKKFRRQISRLKSNIRSLEDSGNEYKKLHEGKAQWESGTDERTETRLLELDLQMQQNAEEIKRKEKALQEAQQAFEEFAATSQCRLHYSGNAA